MLAIWNSSDNYLGDQNQKVGETITQITTADLPRQDKSHDRIIPDLSRHIPDRLSSFNSPHPPPDLSMFPDFPEEGGHTATKTTGIYNVQNVSTIFLLQHGTHARTHTHTQTSETTRCIWSHTLVFWTTHTQLYTNIRDNEVHMVTYTRLLDHAGCAGTGN